MQGGGGFREPFHPSEGVPEGRKNAEAQSGNERHAEGMEPIILLTTLSFPLRLWVENGFPAQLLRLEFPVGVS